MSVGYPPSHWNPAVVQPAVCDLCQNVRNQAELVESEVRGLEGLMVCSDCQRSGATTLGYEEIIARDGHFEAPMEEIELQEPFGSTVWWNDPYNDPKAIKTEGGLIWVTEDDGRVIVTE